jgi:AcrR family transcriptional regulator
MKQEQAASNEERAYHHGDLRRSLINAALALVNEEQAWDFSLREVARRAGVSHNAPYNHFADKRELLAAVAEAGFLTLRDKMHRAAAGVEEMEKALIRSGVAYVKFGIENPAHYRLMFGPTLMTATGLPDFVMHAADSAKAILTDIFLRGAQQGVFLPRPEKKEEIQLATLAAWSIVHGLTLLAIDGHVGPTRLKTESIAEKVTSMFSYGIVRR